MKKAGLILGLTVVLSLAMNGTTLGSTAYLETYALGGWSMTQDSYYYYGDDYDSDALRGIVVEADIPINHFRFNLEYQSGTKENYVSNNGFNRMDCDFSSYFLKAGYRVIDDPDFIIDLLMGFYNRSYDYKGDDEFQGFTGGAELIWNIDDTMSLEGSFDLTPFATATNYNKEFDTLMMFLKLKFNYFLTESWGLSAGYRACLFAVEDSVNTVIEDAGIMVGGVVRF